MSNAKWITVRPARFVPIGLTALAIAMGILVSPWCFLSIPFVLVGSVFTAPNLNLINGMPSYLLSIVGLIILSFHQPSGLAVFLGTISGFLGSALEMLIFAKPVKQ